MGDLDSVPCPHGCGYYRPYRNHPDYLDRFIDHPAYGHVQLKQVVISDLKYHDCIRQIRCHGLPTQMP